MRHVSSRAGVAGIGIAAAAVGLAAATVAVPAVAATAAANSFAQTNLIASSASFKAKLVDPNLTNAWGLAAGGTPIWVSDNDSGLATVYSGGISGSAVTLDLTVQVPGGHPTGQVFNPDGAAFDVAGSPSVFIVATDQVGASVSSEIAGWNGGGPFVVEDGPKGGPGGKTPAHAEFTGLAEATTPKAGPELFAADFNNAKIDVFNKNFHPLSTPSEFRDPKIPHGYAPYNIQLLGGKLYVTYAKHAKGGPVFGGGLGFVDVYTVNGALIKHLVAHGALDAPWGLAIAPKGFGPFGGALLVGNLGNGWINAYNPTTGKHLGWLDGTNGKPIAISGLWGLEVGNSSFGGAKSLVFSAGPKGYRAGLVGVLNPAAASSGGGGGW